MNKIDPQLFDGLLNRRIVNYNPDDVRKLLTILAQLLGMADSDGVLIIPGSGEAEQQPAKQK